MALSGATSALSLPLAHDAVQGDKKKPSTESDLEQGHGTGPNTHEQHEMTGTEPSRESQDGKNKPLPNVSEERPQTPVATTSKNKLDDKPPENIGGKWDPKSGTWQEEAGSSKGSTSKAPSVTEQEVEGKGKGKAVDTKPPSVKEDEAQGKGKEKAVEVDPKNPKPQEKAPDTKTPNPQEKTPVKDNADTKTPKPQEKEPVKEPEKEKTEASKTTPEKKPPTKAKPAKPAKASSL